MKILFLIIAIFLIILLVYFLLRKKQVVLSTPEPTSEPTPEPTTTLEPIKTTTTTTESKLLINWSASPFGMGGVFYITINDQMPAIVQVYEESTGIINVNVGDIVTVYMDGGGCTGVGVKIDGYCSDSSSGQNPGHQATCSAVITTNTTITGGSCTH